MAIDTYIEELADERVPLRAARLTDLSALSPDELPRFRAAWPRIPCGRRLAIVRRLADLADDNVDLDFTAVFTLAMTDEDAEVRLAALQGLWEYEGRDLIAPLIAVVKDDPEPGVRAAAALALGRYAVLAEFDRLRPADVAAVDAALAEVARDPAEAVEVRARAVEAAGARSEPWVRDLIDDAYASGNQRLRVAAIHAMGRNCDPAWLPGLIDNLHDDDPEVRYEAATACGSIADDEATPHLADLIDDDDVEVRLAAIEALGAIGAAAGSDEAREALEAHAGADDETVREAVRAALEGIRATSEPFLIAEWPLGDNKGNGA